MAYKILYIEDLNPASIVSDLKANEFEVEALVPTTFEKMIKDIYQNKFDAILLDFRLTEGGGNEFFDAPIIAQTLRTQSANNKKHFPIFLISSETNISLYYHDFTSSDLFDISLEKEAFQKDTTKHCNKFKEFIRSYAIIEEKEFELPAILNIKPEKISELDFRFIEKFGDSYFKDNSYKISRLVYRTLIKSIGALMGEEVLSSRLGIKLESEGWENLKAAFDDAKYAGIFFYSYNRWWSTDVEKICSEKFGINNLRRLKAQQRVEAFLNAGFKEISALEKIEFAESTNFWTICKDLHAAIDPIDGLELMSKEAIPWQDKEFISLLAAMRSSDYLKIVKPSELERFHEFEKSYTQ